VPLAVEVAPVRVEESKAVCPTTIDVAERVVLIVGLCIPPLMTTDTTVVVLMALLVPPVPVKVTL
jgi:hypothetical protein